MMAPATNPFGAPSAQPASSVFGNPSIFGQTRQASPFGTPTTSAGFQAVGREPSPALRSAANPFGQPSGPSTGLQMPSQSSQNSTGALQPATFGQRSSSPNPFTLTAQPTKLDPVEPIANPFGVPSNQTSTPFSNPFGSGSPAPTNPFGIGKKSNQLQAPAFGGYRASTAPADEGRNTKTNGTNTPESRLPTTMLRRNIAQPTEETRQLSAIAGDFADKVHKQLRNDGLTPPQWPSDPGNPDQHGSMEKLKENYKKYRSKVYASLRKAELIDDPEKRRKLEDALTFKGTCEDMCPDFEQVTRIVEYDVKQEEKAPAPGGLTMWPDPMKMVKKFGRSAAGQDAPLPMDVRSVDALKRSTDYLLDDLLQSDENLPSLHNYLWDRTRAVRKDFTFHSAKSPEEMKVLVYCFETITRFHATALHLLCRKGFAGEGFDQKQEIEQLGRSLLSLIEAYDDCKEKGVECENEAEFRAYHLLLNAHDPFIVQRSLEWGQEFWFNSDEVQLAFSLIHALQSVEEPRGPMRPLMGSTLADSSFTNFLSIVASPKTSYTMACFAEIHFTHIRQCMLKNLVKAYSRRRDWPKDITAAALNQMLRFDTDEEAVDFAMQHDFEFSSENSEQSYMLLKSKNKVVPSPRVRQSYSGKLVERKRGTRSLPFVIHHTVYEESNPKIVQRQVDNPNSLFVSSADFASEQKDLDQTQKKNENQASQGKSRLFGTQYTNQGSAPADAAINGFPVLKGSSSPFVQPIFSSTTQAASNHPANLPAQSGTTSGKRSASEATNPSLSAKRADPFGSDEQLAKPPTSHDRLAGGAAAHQTPFQSSTSAGPSPISFLNGASMQTPSSVLSAPVPSKTESPTSFLPASTPAAQHDNAPSFTMPPPIATKDFAYGPQGKDAPLNILAQGPAVQPSPNTPATSANPSFPPATTSEQPSLFKKPESLSSPSAANMGSDLDPSRLKPPPGDTAGGSATDQSFSSQAKVEGAKGLQIPGFPLTAQSNPAFHGNNPSKQASFQTPAPAATALPKPPKPPAAPKDLMGSLTKWFVQGDGGLLEQFTEITVQDLLHDTFAQWERQEAERKQKQEEERSWAAARQHQVYNLCVKYFYRWQKNARALAHRRILREGKAKIKAYWERERADEKLKRDAVNKARDSTLRKEKAEADMARFISWDPQPPPRPVAPRRTSNVEEQLLQSGIFSGLKDERVTARRVVRAAEATGWHRRSASVASTQDMGPPPSPFAREGWKTRSLREQFGVGETRSLGRRSTSVASSSVNGGSYSFSQSQPLATTKVTNFSRNRGHDTYSNRASPSPSRNGMSSRHWDLRARGLVQMPDGQWLPESIALPMQEGHRFTGVGDCGLGPGKGEETEVRDAQPSRLELLAARFGFSNRASPVTGGSVANGGTPATKSKRKRSAEEEENWVDEYGVGSPPSAKKVELDGDGSTKQMVQDTRKMLADLRDTMDKMDEDRPWFRDQIDQMEKRRSMWD